MTADGPLAWKVRDSRALLSRPPWVDVEQETVELPDGRVVGDFYTVRLPDFAVVLALTPLREVVTLRHYRHGAGAVVLSLPAGHVDAGEDPGEAAARELLEESGYAAQRLEEMGRFIVDGNRGCGWCHCFLATGCWRVAEPAAQDLAEASVELAPWDGLRDLLAAGEFGELACAAAVGLGLLRLG